MRGGSLSLGSLSVTVHYDSPAQTLQVIYLRLDV